MGILSPDYDKTSDENFFYLKYFVDLEGNKIYSRRIKKEQESKKNAEMNYQRHPDLAETIINEDKELKAIWEKLQKEINIWWLDAPMAFLIYWGYVSVDLADDSDNWYAYDSVTIPENIRNKIEEDPLEIFFRRQDVAWQYKDEEEYDELCKLHKRILEERSKIEQNKATVASKVEPVNGDSR